MRDMCCRIWYDPQLSRTEEVLMPRQGLRLIKAQEIELKLAFCTLLRVGMGNQSVTNRS